MFPGVDMGWAMSVLSTAGDLGVEEVPFEEDLSVRPWVSTAKKTSFASIPGVFLLRGNRKIIGKHSKAH